MGNAINLTPYAVGELAGKDPEGFPLFVVVVNLLTMGQVVVGQATAACLRALATGKPYYPPRGMRRAP